MRTLIEGLEWDASRARAVIASPRQWDDSFRAASFNIAVEPYKNTTPFLSERARILPLEFPLGIDLAIYFRIADDDESCTLLWVESVGGPRVLVQIS
jgi:hypothetical protein